MPEFRRILCPIDFSESSRAALELAARLARRDAAGLTVLHVTGSHWPGEQGAILPRLHPGEKGETTVLAEWTADAERLAGGTVSSVLLSPPCRGHRGLRSRRRDGPHRDVDPRANRRSPARPGWSPRRWPGRRPAPSCWSVPRDSCWRPAACRSTGWRMHGRPPAGGAARQDETRSTTRRSSSSTRGEGRPRGSPRRPGTTGSGAPPSPLAGARRPARQGRADRCSSSSGLLPGKKTAPAAPEDAAGATRPSPPGDPAARPA